MSGRKLSVKIRKLRKIENQMAGERLWTWKRFRLFPECYQYEEKELNVILSAALASAECRQAVENVKRMEKNADEMEDEKDRNGGHADETKTKENSGGYANSKDFAGGSFSQGV